MRLLLAFLLLAVTAAAADKPNVLFIAIDDLNHWVGYLGRNKQTIANTDASMPQALVLMNSELFQSILKPHTQLKLNLSAAKYLDGQLTAVYQTLLSRARTAAEKAAWAKAEQTGLNIEDLILP